MPSIPRNPGYDIYRVIPAAIGFLILSSVVRPELIPDGAFTTGQGTWSVTSGTTVDFSNGDARVSGRTARTKGVAYNLLPHLNAGMAGKAFTARCRVTVASPTPVRLFLRTVEAGSPRSVILAEEVIRDSGVPHELRGTRTFDWSAFPSAAVLDVSIGYDTFNVRSLPLGGVFPDYTIDDVSIDDDTDADGLTDAEEAVIGTSPLKKDHDDDGIPDRWEYEHHTNPLEDSDEVDEEPDGWNNRLEYWAATDPWNADSRPGVPSNPNASPEARAVIEYLATLPANGAANHAVVGQHVTSINDPVEGYAKTIGLLGAPPISRYPGVIAFQFDDGGNPPPVSSIRSYVEDHWDAGGLVEIKYNPRHPWTQGFYDNFDPSIVDIPALVAPDPNSPSQVAVHDFFVGELDTVAAELQYLRDRKIIVLWRFCSEMTGPHFWWGYRGQAEYIQLWRFIHDYFTDPDGWDLTNLLWVYESEGAAHSNLPIDYYYPGDDYVDLLGHNYYHDSFHLEFDANDIMSRYPKVYACPQVGPHGDPVSRNSTFSNLNYLVGTDGVSGFINRHPRLSYFSVWNSFFNSYYHHIAIVDNPDADLFMQHDYLVTRDELPSQLWQSGATGVSSWALY